MLLKCTSRISELSDGAKQDALLLELRLPLHEASDAVWEDVHPKPVHNWQHCSWARSISRPVGWTSVLNVRMFYQQVELLGRYCSGPSSFCIYYH